MDWKNIKKQTLETIDLSRKGSVDESIRQLVNFINGLDNYATTSSCSGRSVLFANEFCEEAGAKRCKRGCKWLLTSHEPLNEDDLVQSVDPSLGNLVFKFEPFILHVLCSDLEAARLLLTVSLGCGFRESGIMVGKHGKTTVAVRSNLKLEVPLSKDGVMLVSDVYLRFLTDEANDKLKSNEQKIQTYYILLKEKFESGIKNS